MGFNGVRKHQKIEDERFFYYADIMGFAVWCELPSNHWFCNEGIKDISEQWLDIVTQNYNHPSLVTLVLFNESWGYGVSVNSDEEFLERFGSLIRAVESMDISGYCYTQLTDVEQETNGLLTADRKPKVDTEKIREIVG